MFFALTIACCGLRLGSSNQPHHMSDTNETEDEQESITLRMPADLKAALADMAKSNHRSLSGQVRFFCEQAVSQSNAERDTNER